MAGEWDAKLYKLRFYRASQIAPMLYMLLRMNVVLVKKKKSMYKWVLQMKETIRLWSALKLLSYTKFCRASLFFLPLFNASTLPLLSPSQTPLSAMYFVNVRLNSFRFLFCVYCACLFHLFHKIPFALLLAATCRCWCCFMFGCKNFVWEYLCKRVC